MSSNDYIQAHYWIRSRTSLMEVAHAIAIGQSVDNPLVSSPDKYRGIYDKHAAIVGGVMGERSGYVDILFPRINLNWEQDGVAHLLCQLQGGQSDIDFVEECKLLDVDFPESISPLGHPGLKSIRAFLGVYDKPLLGGIVKPKIGMDVGETLDVVKQMVEGGVDFVKDDEILANQDTCPIFERVTAIADYLSGLDKRVIYIVSITGDPQSVLSRANLLSGRWGVAVHVNWWAGLGIYKAIRERSHSLFLFFQRSGIQSLIHPRNPFGIHWRVICKLAAYSGADIIHAGMWGGYKSDDEHELGEILALLRGHNVLPSLSCGMHPGLVDTITEKFGVDYLANVGGAIHNHPMGVMAGAKAMRQAIDGVYSKEYYVAVDKWGKT